MDGSCVQALLVRRKNAGHADMFRLQPIRISSEHYCSVVKMLKMLVQYVPVQPVGKESDNAFVEKDALK